MPFNERLYKTAYYMLGNAIEAEDAVQDVLVKLWEIRAKLNSYKYLEAFAVTMVRNKSLDIIRRRRGTIVSMDNITEEQNDMQQDLIKDVEVKEKLQLLKLAIERLKEPQKTIVELRHFEDKDFEEIAEMLGMEVNAVRVSLSRARKVLRSLVQNY